MDNKWIKLTKGMVAPFSHWVPVSSPQGSLILIDDNPKKPWRLFIKGFKK